MTIDRSVGQNRYWFVALVLALFAVRCASDETVGVESDRAARVTISPPDVDIAEGVSTTFRAVVVSQLGDTLLNKTVVWSSTNQQVATVTAEGHMTAVRPGRS